MTSPTKYLIHSFIALVFAALFCMPVNGYKSVAQHPIDIVFCLDLSGSTNGLLFNLRNQLWDIVNESNSLNPQPNLRIGVVGFSRPSFGKNNYYIKTLVDLTSDFDLVANSIYNIKPSVERGDHFVGAAISHSVNQLNWSNEDQALKLLFLVGNGDVRNGSINYAAESETAFTKKNIIVNTIFCQPSYSALEMSGWKRIAELGGGRFFDIHIGTEIPPMVLAEDANKIMKLTKELNNTYLYYGNTGKIKYAQMVNADKNSRWESQYVFESRVFYKTSSFYQNSNQDWDLVDCIKANGKGVLASIDREFLPEKYQVLNNDDLFEVILKKKNDRNRIVCELRLLINNDRQNLINNKLTEIGVQERDHVLQFIVKHVIQHYGIDKGFQTSN